jgi:hypothetical protein
MHSVIVSMIECPAAANVSPLAADPGGRDQTECPPGSQRRYLAGTRTNKLPLSGPWAAEDTTPINSKGRQ